MTDIELQYRQFLERVRGRMLVAGEQQEYERMQRAAYASGHVISHSSTGVIRVVPRAMTLCHVDIEDPDVQQHLLMLHELRQAEERETSHKRRYGDELLSPSSGTAS